MGEGPIAGMPRSNQVRLALALASYGHLPFSRRDPGELPDNGAFKSNGGRSRTTTWQDNRAFRKRVDKRRRKKGYGHSTGF